MADLWGHPQLAARQRWTEVSTPVGPVPALLPPGAHDGAQVRMDPIPAVGQHSAAILHELGYAANDIEQLRNDKVI
jgi:itaconate CoA-transferase